MSIAQLRTSFSPHYLVVALALVLLAGIAFGATAINAAPAANGDTETNVDANGNGAVADGELAVTLTPSQSSLLNSATQLAGAQTDTGALTITNGSLFALNSGIKVALQTWTGGGAGDFFHLGNTAFYPSGYVGTVTAKADNTTTLTSNVNTPSVITIVGAPVFTFNLQATGADPAAAAAIPSLTNVAANVDYNDDADLYVGMADANGTAYPNGVTVTLQIDNLTLAAFSTARTAFTVSQATVADDITVGGVGARDGVAPFVDAGNDEGITANILKLRGTITVTASITEGSATKTIPITGPVTQIQAALFDITNVDTDGSDALSVVTYGAAAPNALGTLAPTYAPDVLGNTTVAVRVEAQDEDGTVVNVLPAAAAPTIADTNLTVGAGFVAGGTAMADFGVAGANGVAAQVIPGRAWGLLVGGGTAVQGDHTIRASFLPTGTLTPLTADNVIRQGAVPAAINFALASAQTSLSLGADQIGTITSTVTSSDGGIVGDRTPVTATAPAAAGVTFVGGNSPFTANTLNGVATMTMLPTGADAIVTFTLVSGLITETFQINFGSAAVTTASPSAVVVTATATELLLGSATTVSAAVTLTDGSAGGGVNGIWSEGTAVAAVPSNVTATSPAGISEITFTGDEVGVRAVTFTVVNLQGGVVIETAVKGTVNITVSAPEVVEEVVEVVSGVAGLTSETGFSAYIVSTGTTATELSAGLSAASIIWLWDGSAWIFFAAPNGVELPGSQNFDVVLGSILFIG